MSERPDEFEPLPEEELFPEVPEELPVQDQPLPEDEYPPEQEEDV